MPGCPGAESVLLAAVLQAEPTLPCDNEVDLLMEACSQVLRTMLMKFQVFKEQAIFIQIGKVQAYILSAFIIDLPSRL